MHDDTRDALARIIDAIESVDGVDVTTAEANEYIRGDPTTEDATVTGAEISITAYLSLAEPGDTDDDNPFRYK